MKFIFILFLSFFSLFTGNNYLKAAERINIKFEDMTIPLTIDQLSKLETYKNDSTEVMDWFMKNGFSKVLELSKFLNFPVFKEDGLNRKLLNSWVGKKVLNEMSNTILVPNDKKGIEVFNTIENLLDIQKEVSTLDILKALPSREIILDIDNLIIIISSWKKELALQQNLILELNALEKTNYQLFINKHTNKKPYAVVQLRQDNKLGTLYNIVGFQTKMTYSAQKNVFKNIPGLQNAKFARFGGLHRNTFIKSPKFLDKYLRLKNNNNIFFAGQITGVEGYVESTAIGNLLSRILSSIILNKKFISPPKSTAHGALHNHITKNANIKTFQPMNINFGIIDSYNENSKVKGKEKKALKTAKAIKDFKNWLKKSIN